MAAIQESHDFHQCIWLAFRADQYQGRQYFVGVFTTVETAHGQANDLRQTVQAWSLNDIFTQSSVLALQARLNHGWTWYDLVNNSHMYSTVPAIGRLHSIDTSR